MGAQSDLVLRGGTFQQVLVVLDGLRLNDPITGHFSSYIPIAPAEIERIEILKGASSALHGSDAVGGVVHIITKTFAAKSSMGNRKSLGATVLAGEWGLLHTSAGGYHKSGKTAVAGGVLTNNSTGQPLRGTRGFFNVHTASLSINQVLNEQWQVSLRSAWDSRRFGAQNFYTISPADSADEKVTSLWNQLQLRYQNGTHKLSVHGGFKKVEDEFRFNPKSLPNNNRSTLYQALALYEHNFFKTSYLPADQITRPGQPLGKTGGTVYGAATTHRHGAQPYPCPAPRLG
jgi:iron complex outermembrane receptor protein